MVDKRVLLVGMNDRAGLTAARSLHSKGVIVDAIFLGRTVPRWRSNTLSEAGSAHPEQSLSKASEIMRGTLTSHHYDAVFPLSDALTLMLSLEEHWEHHSGFPPVTREQVDRARNKRRLIDLCEVLDVRVPPTQIESDVRAWDNQLPVSVPLPCFVKPAYTATERNDQILKSNVNWYGSWLTRSSGK